MMYLAQPNKKMFTISMVSSTIISITSTNWSMIWMGFEANLMTMLPIMSESNLSKEMEATIKYFIVQTMSSNLMLMSITMTSSSLNKPLSSLILMASLLMKMAIYPFHSWLPPTLSTSAWWTVLILTTWQKIAPLMILNELTLLSSLYLQPLLMANATHSVIMALNQTNLRPIIAYSSIHHTTWILITYFQTNDAVYLYFILYWIMITPPIFHMSLMKMSKANHLNSMSKPSWLSSFSSIIHMFTISGMPPTLGFMPKMIVLLLLTKYNLFLLPFILIMCSAISLYFYSMITFSMIMSSSKTLTLESLPHNVLLSITLLSCPILTLTLFK